MEDLLAFLISDTFTAVNNITAIISLIISIMVLLNVRKIQSYYLFTARAPNLLEQLRSQSSKLADYMNEFEDFLPQIAVVLAESEVIVASLSRKVDRRSRGPVDSLLKSLRSHDPLSKDQDSVWRLYVGMNKVHAAVEDIQQDMKWEVSP